MQKSHLISLLAGNLLEHYDTALFGLLSPLLAPLFFPHQDFLVSLILTYALIPLGMIVKPLGALFFGYISDYVGRRQSLLLSLCGMSGATCGFAFLPTYQDLGIYASLLLAFLRLMQSFFASGETISGAILMLEKSPQENHTFLSSLWDAATIGGVLLASFGVTFISLINRAEELWRLLYVMGCLTALIAFLLRFYLPKQGKISTKGKRYFIQETCKTLFMHRKALFMIACASGFSYSTYIVAFVLMNAFIPLISPHTFATSIQLNSALLILDFLLLPCIGALSNHYKREKVMFLSSLAAVLFGLPSFMLLKEASFLVMASIRIIFIFIGVGFSASFYAWSQNLVPKEHRGVVISFGYSLGSQLLGGPTAAFSLWLYKISNSLALASTYWSFLALLCLLLFANAFRTSKHFVNLKPGF